MLQNRTAILLGICSALAACDGAPSRDLTAPDPDAGALDALSASPLAASNTWAAKHLLPIALQRSVAGAFNNIIYVVGGTKADGTVSNSVYAYTIATNSWAARASLPTRRTELNGASVINARLYVTGGFNTSGIPTKTLYVYNPATNTWVQKANLPVPSACGAQGVIGDLLYVYTAGVMCGAADFGEHRLLRYNPTTNTWVTLAAPPTTHHWGASGVIGGKFYLAGGRDDFSDINLSVNVYNPATNSWQTKAPLPSEQLRAASGVLGGKLYVAGGGNVGIPQATLRVYNPTTNTWATKAPMPTARWATFGVNAGGLLWVIGGLRNNNSNTTGRVEAYTP